MKSVPKENQLEQANTHLSDLQKEIIRLIKQGSTTQEIALVTGFTLDKLTVERKSILKTTGCQTMFDVISRADKNNWL